MPPDAEKLAALCMSWMEQEREMLEKTLAVLRHVRAGLLNNDQGLLQEAQQRQEELARETEVVRQARAGFRTKAAQELGVAAEVVTLSFLTPRLPAAAANRLARGRERLCRLAAEVDKLNQGNVALIYFCLDFLDRFFTDMTGSEPRGGSYGPAGTQQEGARGSIIQARG